MSNVPAAHFEWELVVDVAVVRVLSRDIDNPQLSQEFGAQLKALFQSSPTKRLLLNFQKTKFMSSTTFAMLLEFGKRVKEADGQVTICALNPTLRLGADIVGLGRIMSIYESEATALAVMAKTGTAS